MNTFLICNFDEDLLDLKSNTRFSKVAEEISVLHDSFYGDSGDRFSISMDDPCAMYALQANVVKHMIDVDLYSYDLWRNHGQKIYTKLSNTCSNDLHIEQAVGMLSSSFSDLRDDLDQTWYFQDINVNIHEALLAEISYLKYQNMQTFICQLKDLCNRRNV